MVKEGEDVASATESYKILQEKSAKLVGMSNEDWEEMDLKKASMIQLYPTDNVMYNMMEETVTGLWSRLETLYIMKRRCTS